MKKLLLPFVLAGCCLSPTMRLQAEYIKYKDPSVSIPERVDDLMSRMTPEEKTAQLMQMGSHMILDNGKLNPQKLHAVCRDASIGFFEGITMTGPQAFQIMNDVQRYMIDSTRLGIPVFTLSESLHGAVNDGCTIYPQAIALGSTFNTDLSYRMASAVAEELKTLGITQTLSPVVDVCRDLRWGRVEECFGEDPLLASRMGAMQVRGYLDHGISPMLKHFGPHGAPTGGLNLSSVSCGQRELLSVFMKPFEYIVRTQQPWAVMSSYNSWDGVPNSGSPYLLTTLLRDTWGFKGYVYSDWGSIDMLSYFHHTARNNQEAALQAFGAGLDVEADINCYRHLQTLADQGKLSQADIDRAVRRVLTAKFAMGLFEYQFPTKKSFRKNIHTPQQQALARQIAEESVVLLQNNGQLLPLDLRKLKSVALIGPNADQVQFGDYTWSRSNHDGVTLLEAFREKAGKDLRIEYAKGCDLHTDSADGISQAVAAARRCDVSIVVVGSASASLARDYTNATCGEGYDLSDMSLTGRQQELIEQVQATGKPVIVVLLAGKPFAMPWVKRHVPAILVQWYPGEQGGYALYDILFGKVNPSGKLNYSFPQSTGNMPCYYNHLPTDRGFYHQPGQPNRPGRDYVFETPGPLWAFGHGLSYSKFEYSNLLTDKTDYAPTDTIHLSVSVRNSSPTDGKEVVQVYVRDLVSSVVTPVQELKAFAKVMIPAGQEKKVQLDVPVQDLGLYNAQMEYTVEPGQFELQVGTASDQIALRRTIGVDLSHEQHITSGPAAATSGTTIKEAPISVSGYVRDVQANPVENAVIESAGQTVRTDKHGFFSLRTLTTEVLHVSGKRLEAKTVPVNGQKSLNIVVIRK